MNRCFSVCAPSRNTTPLCKDVVCKELPAIQLLPYTESDTFTEILSISGRFFEFLFYAAKILKFQIQTTDIPHFTFKIVTAASGLVAGCEPARLNFRLPWAGSQAVTTATQQREIGLSPAAARCVFGLCPSAPHQTQVAMIGVAHSLRGTIRD